MTAENEALRSASSVIARLEQLHTYAVEHDVRDLTGAPIAPVLPLLAELSAIEALEGLPALTPPGHDSPTRAQYSLLRAFLRGDVRIPGNRAEAPAQVLPEFTVLPRGNQKTMFRRALRGITAAARRVVARVA